MIRNLFTSIDNRTDSKVEVDTTHLGALSISVTDHSSHLRRPERLWGFINVDGAIVLRNALDVWIAEQTPSSETRG